MSPVDPTEFLLPRPGLRRGTLTRPFVKGVVILAMMAGALLLTACGQEEKAEVKAPEPREDISHTLSYSAGEHGSVEGINRQTVARGEDGMTVTAVAENGYHFTAWSDGVTTASRTDRQVTADLDVTASFLPNQYILTYVADEQGRVEGAKQQTVKYGEAGSEVTAVADDGYHFTAWSDGVTTVSRTDRQVTADLDVTASFLPNRYTLTYAAEEQGRIEGAASQTVEHGSDGSPVTALPDANHHFTAWSDGLAAAERIDRQVTADLRVTAGFAKVQYTLTYRVGEHGRIDGAKQQTVKHGEAGSEVKAVADNGYHFTGWSDGVTSPSRVDRNLTTSLDVTAGFDVNRYTLTYTAGENGRIEGPDQQTVNYGEAGSTVTAVADEGYHFVTWSDGLNTAERRDARVVNDLSLTAVFAVNTYTVGGVVDGLFEGTSLVLQNNGGDDLVISANGDFSFSDEMLDEDAYAVIVRTQPTAPNQTCSVSDASGLVSGADVANIRVSCVLNRYRVGGTVTGLPAGERIVLKNAEGEELTINGNGAYTFAEPLEDGSAYAITLAAPPERPNWTCDIDNGEGTMAGADVNDVNVSCYVKAVLQATPGIRKIKLSWNVDDFQAVTFDLCHAEVEIADDSSVECRQIEGAKLYQAVSHPQTVDDLKNDVPYWFRLEVHHADGRQTNSDVIEAMAFGGLNDTGIMWCADSGGNRMSDGSRAEMAESCNALAGSYPGQDAHTGRDALSRSRDLVKSGHGPAGFDFTKICRNGFAAGSKRCPPNPSPGTAAKNWGCTLDNVTGLLWEVKTASGPQSADATFSWYNPDGTLNGGDPGVRNVGKCAGTSCDTHSLVLQVNADGLCGSKDWRLPTRDELLSIIDNSKLKPAVDTRYFPNTEAAYYWTATSYADQAGLAWQVYFLYGESSPDNKNQGRHVRLVSGRTMTFGLDNP